MSTDQGLIDKSRGHSVGHGPAALAVDVGGTKIKAGLINEAGEIIDAELLPTPVRPSGSAELIIDTVQDLVGIFRERHGEDAVRAVSMVIPGIVDDSNGVGIYSANLHWENIPFKDILTEKLDMPVTVYHDVRAAGIAEFSLVEGNPKTAVMITIGTGIAAAIRIAGHLYAGGGYAGEIGWSTVTVNTETGIYHGPMERIASAAAIARRYTGRTGKLTDGSREVYEAMQAGDPIAREVWDEGMEALGSACAKMVSILAPDAIIFGGGLASAVTLHEDVQKSLDRRLTFQKRPKLYRAQLGSVAGMLGAAMLTRPDVAKNAMSQIFD